jgi:hypothetical protein
MLAIVLTGLVVLLAYTAAQVGFASEARLAARTGTIEGAHAVRELLVDALRNARAPTTDTPQEPGFSLSHDTLSFVAGGGAGPLDPDYDWLLALAPRPGRSGLDVTATPLGHAPGYTPPSVSFPVPGVIRWSVRVLAPGDSTWQRTWSEASVLPRAVEIVLTTDSAVPMIPLHVVLWTSTTDPRLRPGSEE